jgi:hypothetical protein
MSKRYDNRAKLERHYVELPGEFNDLSAISRHRHEPQRSRVSRTWFKVGGRRRPASIRIRLTGTLNPKGANRLE